MTSFPENQSVNEETQAEQSVASENQWSFGERATQWVCWLGILGLVLTTIHTAFAKDPSPGLQAGSRSFQNKTPGKLAPDMELDDDEDDEDDDSDLSPVDRYPGQQAATIDASMSPPSAAPRRTFSAGGQSSIGNDPVRTTRGISVGGSSANNIISEKSSSTIQIDAESAKGGTDIVTDFNFPDADILDIAKTLGKLTGKNFLLDKDVKGKVTIISNSPITVSDAWKAFLTALDMNGFALIPSGKYIRIARNRDARDKQLKTYTGASSPDTDALITRVFPLKHISAEEVARTFRSFVPANARIIPYAQTNTVIVTDTGSNIAKLAKMLDILDVEGYDAGIEVIPVKFASAEELSKLIDALIPGTGGSSGASGARSANSPRFGGSKGTFAARRTKEGGIINTIISDSRTNTLIVHANTKGANQVRELVNKLDQRMPQSSGGGKVHVVYLQFADAEQVANTLNNFSSQSSTGGGGAGSKGQGTGVNPIATSLFEGTIKISPDKATNALVITASPSDFVTVKRVIDRLDIPRDQVYVEVVIMEVEINRNFEYSANAAVAGSNRIAGSITSASDLSSIFTGAGVTNGAVLPFFTGGNTTININNQSFNVSSVTGLIKLLQTNSNSNILATPQIIALDNSEANFESAEKIPILTQTAVQGAGVTQSVTTQPIALSIKIKPQINKITNFVKMDITTKLGDVSPRPLPAGVQDLAFATTERTAQTTVVVGDSDTVVLGGLIRDRVNETVNKIPILGDIPILGWLFKSSKKENKKSNLLIFMTPHIIRQYEHIRAILDKKLRERDHFLESHNGGQDPLQDKRDDMIRSLPDIKELTEKKPKTTFTIDEDEVGSISAPVRNEARMGSEPPQSINETGSPAGQDELLPALVDPTDNFGEGPLDE